MKLFSIVALTILSLSVNLRALETPQSCDPLYGCPIDPIKCIKNPSSCGL